MSVVFVRPQVCVFVWKRKLSYCAAYRPQRFKNIHSGKRVWKSCVFADRFTTETWKRKANPLYPFYFGIAKPFPCWKIFYPHIAFFNRICPSTSIRSRLKTQTFFNVLAYSSTGIRWNWSPKTELFFLFQLSTRENKNGVFKNVHSGKRVRKSYVAVVRFHQIREDGRPIRKEKSCVFNQKWIRMDRALISSVDKYTTKATGLSSLSVCLLIQLTLVYKNFVWIHVFD